MIALFFFFFLGGIVSNTHAFSLLSLAFNPAFTLPPFFHASSLQDYELWSKNRVFESILTEFQNPATDRKSRDLILLILLKVVKAWGWSGRPDQCPSLLPWLCTTKMVQSYPEEVSRIIQAIAAGPRDCVERVAHGLCSAATTLLRSSSGVPAGIKVLHAVSDVLPAEAVPPRLLALLTKILTVAIDSDDVGMAFRTASVIDSYVPSTQDRPPELNGLMEQVFSLKHKQLTAD